MDNQRDQSAKTMGTSVESRPVKETRRTEFFVTDYEAFARAEGEPTVLSPSPSVKPQASVEAAQEAAAEKAGPGSKPPEDNRLFPFSPRRPSSYRERRDYLRQNWVPMSFLKFHRIAGAVLAGCSILLMLALIAQFSSYSIFYSDIQRPLQLVRLVCLGVQAVFQAFVAYSFYWMDRKGYRMFLAYYLSYPFLFS